MITAALIVEPGSTPSSVATSLDMFNIAGRYGDGPACRLDLFSSAGGSVALSSTVHVDTRSLPPSLEGYAAVILPGFFAPDPAVLHEKIRTLWQPVIHRLRELPEDTLVSASCYGTFVLAESGLLDGTEATTTWWLEADFRQHYPKVRLDANSALVDGGRCITAGAMTAHADLSLHVVRRLLGAAVARQVGGIMLVDGARSSQRPFMTLPTKFDDELVQRGVDWLADHCSEELSTEDLAGAMHVSYRTLHRRFRSSAGMAPLAYLQTLRVEKAKELLESTDLSVERIVGEVGYQDVSAFRRLFARIVGLSPAQYRRRFRRPSRG